MNKKKKNELYRAINFIEELSWLIDSSKNVNISELPELLKSVLDGSEAEKSIGNKYISSNPNKHFLVGALPGLLSDSSIFQTNQSIVSFAEEVLEIEILNYHKRSKYEIIGIVVCETNTLSDEKLKNLVKALSILTGNEQKLNEIKNSKLRNDFSWNDTIRSLSGNSND